MFTCLLTTILSHTFPTGISRISKPEQCYHHIKIFWSRCIVKIGAFSCAVLTSRTSGQPLVTNVVHSPSSPTLADPFVTFCDSDVTATGPQGDVQSATRTSSGRPGMMTCGLRGGGSRIQCAGELVEQSISANRDLVSRKTAEID